MNIEYLANIAEVFGMIVVVITLIFLIIQLRQNTSLLRSAATQGAVDEVSELYAPLIENADLTEIFMRGMNDPEDLTPVEMGRFMAFWMRGLFILQNWYFQAREGYMESAAFDSFMKLFTDMYGSAGLRYFWAQRRYAFDADFVDYLENQVFARPRSENYSVFGVDSSG